MSSITELIQAEIQREVDRKNRSLGDLESNDQRLTVGPQDNDISSMYVLGRGAWRMHFGRGLSPDMVVGYRSRMSQMFIRVGEADATAPTSREVRDALIQEQFTVHRPGWVGY